MYEGISIILAIVILGYCESWFCHRYGDVLLLHPRTKSHQLSKNYLRRQLGHYTTLLRAVYVVIVVYKKCTSVRGEIRQYFDGHIVVSRCSVVPILCRKSGLFVFGDQRRRHDSLLNQQVARKFYWYEAKRICMKVSLRMRVESCLLFKGLNNAQSSMYPL